jgi:hypothetical protein
MMAWALKDAERGLRSGTGGATANQPEQRSDQGSSTQTAETRHGDLS